MKKQWIGALAVLSATCLFHPAYADDLVDILHAKGVLSSEEAAKAKAAEASKKKLKVGGRIQVDGALYNNDGRATAQSRMGSGAEFRRARIYVKGEIGDFHYKAQYDFAGNKTAIKDLYIKYTGLPVAIQVGNFKEPFSLEELTSSKYITFMERALPNAFAPSRNIGIALSGHGDMFSIAGGVFTNGPSGTTKNVNSKLDLTGRLTLAPLHEEDEVIHLGAAINYNKADTTYTVRFRERPESHITHLRLVDTGGIANVKNTVRYGLEAAAVWGPFSIQGEYMRTSVNLRTPGVTGPNFSGFYAFASYFLTGESRPYSVKKGAFGRVHPKQNFRPGEDGWGAWEIAARISQIDLEDAGYNGGKESNISLGLNWYPHPHLRWMFNWVHVKADRSPLAPTLNNFGPDVFQMRAQIDF